MLLVMDAGNTNIVLAVLHEKKLVGKWRLSTEAKRTADEYAFILQYFFQQKDIQFSDIKAVVISNVVPQSAYALEQFSTVYLGCTPIVVGEAGVNLGIRVKVENASEVGADRLVNALAAYQTFGEHCIVIDFGTATTFDVLGARGDYLGGVIAPGVHLSMDALYQAAAKLPQVMIAKPEKVIGTSTISAMQSGIYFGYLSMIEGIIERIETEAQCAMTVVATGGLASLFAKGTHKVTHLEPDLTIYGLQAVYHMNKQ